MSKLTRRDFVRLAALTAGTGYIGFSAGNRSGLFAADAPPGPGAAGAAGNFPAEIMDPTEVFGADAVPAFGRLPGEMRMYTLPADKGEFHLVGSQVMKRIARPAETGGVHELSTFSGRTGALMPRHMHRSSHAAILIMGGEVELELAGQRWIMQRGDFANVPTGTPHAWTMRSDRTQLALFSMNARVGSAFVAMGAPHAGETVIPTGIDHAIAPGKLATASFSGDFQLVPTPAPEGEAVRVTNLVLPSSAGPYVILDGGGERFGGNTFFAKNANTGGQFLFIITEGGAGGGVGAHFHARHFENFFAMDGEVLGWANGKAPALKSGDYFQAPPRNLHGFKLNDPTYNRFAAFLTPGIFESFFTRGGQGQNGVPRAPAGQAAAQAPGGGAPRGAGGGGGAPRAGGGAGGGNMFQTLSLGGRGPDGYPLDVHGAKMPLPTQDPIWTQGQGQGRAGPTSMLERKALLEHSYGICGAVPPSTEMSPSLLAALARKPRAQDFI